MNELSTNQKTNQSVKKRVGIGMRCSTMCLLRQTKQRVAGSTVTNDRHHGARGGMYGAYEHYAQPYPFTNP